MKDRLQELFDRQLQQQSNWMDITALTDEERDRLLRDLSLYMIHEIMEFMDARKYKRHKIWEEPLPRDTRIFELIDIQKYLLTAALAEGISADEWYDYFIEKTKIVDDRWEQDQVKWENDSKKVICCDIDDVLTEYKLVADLYDKNEIEEKRMFRDLLPKDENIAALIELKWLGYHIVLMTTRRSWRVGSIQSDTVEWLKENCVPYEMILWGYDKAESIAKRLKNVVPAFAIENSRKHAIDIAEMGIPVYYLYRDGEEPLRYKDADVRNIKNLTQIVRELHG